MKRIIIFILVLFGSILLLFVTDVIWRSPSFYNTEMEHHLDVPVMDMSAYNSIISTHRRPYIYTVNSKHKGKVIVLGVEHTNDQTNAQFDSIKQYWQTYKPDVALVEGRMGFFFKWFMDPIERFGESGLTAELAKANNVELYTWEPAREDEIELMTQQYSAKKLAMFYSLRPFFGIPKEERQHDPESILQDLIKERTDYEHLKNTITTWQEVDSIWTQDFPEIDWRSYETSYGWPGYFHDIWNSSNLSRDEHMIHIIIEEVAKGNTVFVTMGSSHAPRIENTLKAALE